MKDFFRLFYSLCVDLSLLEIYYAAVNELAFEPGVEVSCKRCNECILKPWRLMK